MITTLRDGVRVARKSYWCGMCARPIAVGRTHYVQVNVYNDRAYDWRECLPCHEDHVGTYVSDWAGWDDCGVGCEQAAEWADEAVTWPRHWLRPGRSIHPAERAAARAWLARAAGGEGE